VADGPTLHLTARGVDGATLDAFEVDRGIALDQGRLSGHPARAQRVRDLLGR
jgi:hypothetical protein